MGLAVRLDGPYPDLRTAVAPRHVASDEGCEPEDPPREPVVDTLDVVGAGALLEARLVRVAGDIACAPIDYCVMALRSKQGWWLTEHDDNAWCNGVTGLSSRVETVDEELDIAGSLLVYRAIRVVQTREYVAVRGGKEERWSQTEQPIARACEITSDGTAWCQAVFR